MLKLFSGLMFTVSVVTLLLSCSQNPKVANSKVDLQKAKVRIAKANAGIGDTLKKIVKTKEEWKAQLTNEEFYVLREAGIETRPIVAGNFTLNPVIEYLDHTIHGPLDAANKIHEQGFFVGNHHYDISQQLAQFVDLLKSCLDDQRQ